MGNVKRGLNKINRCLELPEGLLADEAHIEILSDKKVLIDGRCTVLLYSEDEIKINTGTGIIAFIGKKLSIDSLNKESAVISGRLKKIEFSK